MFIIRFLHGNVIGSKGKDLTSKGKDLTSKGKDLAAKNSIIDEYRRRYGALNDNN
jgi:hypothetical protein